MLRIAPTDRTPVEIVNSIALLASLAAGVAPQVPDEPTFVAHVAAIVHQRCSVCHREGEAAPFHLATFEDVRRRLPAVREVIELGLMPPWPPVAPDGTFVDALSLTREERAIIKRWMDRGAPRGDGPEPSLPARLRGEAGDESSLAIVVDTGKPFPVPASGEDLYRYFAVPLARETDTWVRSVRVRPSVQGVVHHVLVFLDVDGVGRTLPQAAEPPGHADMPFRRGALLASWAVGGRPERLPKDFAILLPRHVDLIVQVHFSPSGRRADVAVELAIEATDERPKRPVVTVEVPPYFGAFEDLDVPPGEAAYLLRDDFELPCAVDIVSVGGHAHLICSAMSIDAVQPSGSRATLLDVPSWRFDWQMRYVFATPRRVSSGSRIEASIVYNNTAANPHNPFSPPRRVRWGGSTRDEMGCAILLVSPVDASAEPALRAAIARKEAVALRRGSILELFRAIDADRDGVVTAEELHGRFTAEFRLLDDDSDGRLTRDEAKRNVGRLPLAR